MQMCLTLLLLSCAHLVFYVPLSMFRSVYALVPASVFSALGSEVRLQILGISMELYALVAPVHLSNFVLCLWRVPGFASRLSSLILWRA